MRNWFRKRIKTAYPEYTFMPGLRFDWYGQVFQVVEVCYPQRLDGTYELVVRSTPTPVDDGDEV